MQRPGATKGDQVEIAVVQPALDGDPPDGDRHIVVHRFDDCVRGFLDRKIKRTGDGFHRTARCVAVKLHPAAEEEFRIDAAKHHIGVGDRRFRSAFAVAGRAGLRAGALWPDFQQTVLTDMSNRAAAGADCRKIDMRRDDVNTPIERDLRYRAIAAAIDHPDVATGTTHIEGDRVCRTLDSGKIMAADHTAGEAGEKYFSRTIGRIVRKHLPAV